MATYPPPNFTEPLSVFNPANWETLDLTLTIENADKRYLKYPVAQGLETLQQIIVNGTATMNDSVEIQTNYGSSALRSLTISDNTTNQGLDIRPNANNTNNPSVVSGEIVVETLGTQNAETLTLTTTSTNYSAVKIASNSVSIGAGGNTSTPTTSVSVNGSNGLVSINGVDLSFNTTNPPTFTNDLKIQNQLTLQDTTAPATYYTTFTTQPNGTLNVNTIGNGVPTNPNITFAINSTNWLGLNSATGFIDFNAPNMNIATTNAPTCNASSTISTADNSNKIPSTAWVKSVLSTSQSTLAYYRTGLVYGNQKPLATPLVISVNTGSQTGSGITMCPLVFRMTCSYTNATTPASQQDSGGVSTFCNTCSCIFNYFVYNSQPVVSGTNANYFTNGIGNATSNTAYYNNVVYGNNYGRPFWTTALSNEANVAVVFPFTFTGTPFLNGIKTIQFDPPAVGYPATSAFYWEWTIEVINKANFAGMITSTGFDVNLNC